MKVLVADPIADRGIQYLRDAGHDVVTDYDLDGPALLEAITGVHALIVGSGTQVTDRVYAAAPDLLIVCRAGIGVANIDIDAATTHGVIVANAPEGYVQAAAEHTVAMVFATIRAIPRAHHCLRDGEWLKGEFLGTELNDSTLGIIGFGRVGRAVAKRLSAFGVELVVYDPYISEDRADQLGAELVPDIAQCLDRADIVTIHTPLTSETATMIGDDELARLEGGYLVNCAHGGIVDEGALASAVANGTLRGAAVDVFATEPVSADNPLTAVEGIVVTPHLGAYTETAQTKGAISTAEQVIAAFEREPVVNALNAPSVDESTFQRLRPYIELANTAGTIAVQLFDDRIRTTEIEFAGDISDEDTDLVTASALTGVFQPLEWDVNAVNAPTVAKEHGIDVRELKTHKLEDFKSLVGVSVSNEDHEDSVWGTQFTGGDLRIVRINDYRLEVIPYGHMLIVRNRDQPGVIGFIGTILGGADINIAGMFNGREVIGGTALSVYTLDDPIPNDVLARLREDERIIEATYISLQNST